MSTVTFVTKCWGGDYKQMLSGGFEKKRDACEYPFDDELLILNNEVPLDVEPDVNHYHANKQCYHYYSPGDPSVYYMGEVNGLAQVRDTEYVCYVQGDCITSGGDWIIPAIQVLKKEKEVLVVSPASEVNTWHDTDGYDQYFSDQAFVARAADMRNYKPYFLPRVHDTDYPDYAKGSFEARVGAYLKKTGLKRKILPKFWVHHG